MIRFLAMAALAVTVSFSVATESFAATCKTNITVSGNGAVTQNGAEKKAVNAWKQQAISNHGVFFGDEKAANDGKGIDIRRCARSQLGLMICEVSGRPCQVGAPETSTSKHEIACTDDDPDACVPEVKWVQTKLNEKNKAGLKADGVPGGRTASAIRDFQKAKGLAVTGQLIVDGKVDDALAKALD